ncbi:MAG: hypothetical protein ACR2FU_20060 [Streptosporangiaceae bacterium]
MAKFVYLYTGGQMAATPQEQEKAMQEWGAWFAALGESVTDMGNPFGSSATVSSAGTAEGGTSRAGGYSIVSADSLDDASARTKGCPALAGGGTVEVYEAIEM